MNERESNHEHSSTKLLLVRGFYNEALRDQQQPSPGIRATGLPKGSLKPWPRDLIRQPGQILAKLSAIQGSSDISSQTYVYRSRELGTGQTLSDADQLSLFN